LKKPVAKKKRETTQRRKKGGKEKEIGGLRPDGEGTRRDNYEGDPFATWAQKGKERRRKF